MPGLASQVVEVVQNPACALSMANTLMGENPKVEFTRIDLLTLIQPVSTPSMEEEAGIEKVLVLVSLIVAVTNMLLGNVMSGVTFADWSTPPRTPTQSLSKTQAPPPK